MSVRDKRASHVWGDAVLAPCIGGEFGLQSLSLYRARSSKYGGEIDSQTPARGETVKRKAGLKRRTPLKAKGKPRFKKGRDPVFLDYLRTKPCAIQGEHKCWGIGARWNVEAAHIKTRGSGGADLWNTIPLCPRAHDEQEGRSRQFEMLYGVDLNALATFYTQSYYDELGISPL